MNQQSELNILETNINGLKEKVSSLRELLEGYHDDIDMVRENMWELQQKRSEIVNTEYSNQSAKGKDIAEMNRQIKNWQEALDITTNNIKETKKEIEEYNDELKKLLEERKNIAQVPSRLSEDIKTYNEEIKNLDEKIEIYEQKAATGSEAAKSILVMLKAQKTELSQKYIEASEKYDEFEEKYTAGLKPVKREETNESVIDIVNASTGVDKEADFAKLDQMTDEEKAKMYSNLSNLVENEEKEENELTPKEIAEYAEEAPRKMIKHEKNREAKLITTAKEVLRKIVNSNLTKSIAVLATVGAALAVGMTFAPGVMLGAAGIAGYNEMKKGMGK